MRLGLVIYGSLETLSGGYLYDRQLVQYLHKRGDEVEILSIPWRSYSRRLNDNFSRELIRKLLDLQVDVWLQDELNHASLFWLNRRLHPVRQPPVVAIIHHLYSSERRPAWKNLFFQVIEKAYLHSLDAAIYNSQTTRRSVESLAGRKIPGIIAYPAGDRFQAQISESEVSQRSRAGKQLRLLFLGNVIPRKELDTVLRALSRLPRQMWTLEVAGDLEVDPLYVSTVLQKADSLGLDGQVHFWGKVEDRQLVDLFRTSHVLVVPSSYEGFGIVYLEGMGFGLPAIGSQAGAAQEIITHGLTGYLVRPQDVQSLATCLEALIHDREKLRRMSLAALRRYQMHPTWEQSMGNIYAFLHNLHCQDGRCG